MRRNLKLWLPIALLVGACSSPATRALSPEATDFYVHVNGAWMDANPVPEAYGSWGVFHEINERNKKVLHEIMEDAGARHADASADRLTRQLGSLWASGMDEAAIEAAGIESIRPYLDRVDAIDSPAMMAQVVGELHLIDVEVLFGRRHWLIGGEVVGRSAVAHAEDLPVHVAFGIHGQFHPVVDLARDHDVVN